MNSDHNWPKLRTAVHLGRGSAQILLVVIAAALTLIEAGCKTTSTVASIPPPAPHVVVATVVERDVPLYSEWIGTTEGFVNAQILPKVSGYLLKQDYKDGAQVRAGLLLFEIDDRPYRAALDQAVANLAQIEAQLKQNRQDLVRYTELYKAGVIPKQQFDAQTATTHATGAQAQAAQAAIETARLNVQWTRVFAPIDGVAAIAQAQVGDLVGPTSLLTTVSQLDPIKVNFPISENDYLRFAKPISKQENGPATAAYDGPRLEMILDNGRVYKYPGQFYAANQAVDVQTGTIQIQAVFPNPGDILRPGMYGKVRAQTGMLRDALLVPQSAVNEVQGLYQVDVVGPGNAVEIRTVQIGRKAGALWTIEKGLGPGERVIVQGLQKVRAGMTVTPTEQAAAAASPGESHASGPTPVPSPAPQG